jgi:hypothetical protein
MVPTSNQITAQVDAVLAKDPDARCIGIRSLAKDTWPETVSVRNRSFRLQWCASSLAARQALIEADQLETGAGGRGLVLLIQLGDGDLGSDVIARLSRGRVFQVERWDMVRQVFQANEIDSRLAKQTWMAHALLEYLPPEGYPPVPGGFLDLATAWKHVLSGGLGMPEARPDLVSLLRWSMAADRVGRFALLPTATQDPMAKPQVIDWLSESAGPVGELVMGCVASGNGLDAMPIGLLCSVVFAPGSEGQSELAAASVRLERYTGDRRISPQHGRRWAEAATWLMRSLTADETRPYVERAEGLLRELHLVGYAGLSDVLPSGFEARLAKFGTAIQALLAQPSLDALSSVEQDASHALNHDFGATAGNRNERVLMALRLARWLLAVPPNDKLAKGFSSLAKRYAQDAAYVDWARLKLLGGDELAALSSSYTALADTIRKQREGFSKQFAAALKAWNAEVIVTDECLPVETVLDRLVGPLAQQSPVLLLVVDGLSYPIFRELCPDMARDGWMEHISESATAPQVGIAALPTVTEISRASLLAGQLTCGASSQEKVAFAAHPALLAASKAGGKPILFHKGELGDASGLSQQVREVVGNRARKVVGVVYNAVDDHLSGSDQLHLRWSLDDLRLLKPLLHEARLAGRTLIITADHGHVIDEKTTQRSATEGDRWRSSSGPVQDDEILLERGRVRAPSGGNFGGKPGGGSIVCAWSEHLRYSSKKNGYHGGVSPQEVVVPLSVFVPPLGSLAGWKPAPPSQPEWWENAIPSLVAATPVPASLAKPRRKDKSTPDLFGGEPPLAPPDWIASLLACSTYQQQRQLAARVAPRDPEIRGLLEALDARGGKLGKAALAQRLGMPLMRVSGFVNAARRVLNVDQSAVLSLDETAAQVEFNRELLEVQFQLRIRK